jgi:hypothetical protein
MFHSITKGEVSAADQISITDFRKMMNDLHDMGFEAVNMQQAADFLYTNAKIPQRSVLLIVDDRKYREYFDKTFKNFYDQWGWKVVNAWLFSGSWNIHSCSYFTEQPVNDCVNVHSPSSTWNETMKIDGVVTPALSANAV